MRNVFLGLSLSVLLLLLGSCASTVNVFDDTLPDEEMATLYWAGGNVLPVAYNGINLNWKYGSGWKVIKIPGGNTSFEIEGTSGGNYQIYRWKGYTFSYNFEKGKEYTVSIPYGSVVIYKDKPTSSLLIQPKERELAVITPDWD